MLKNSFEKKGFKEEDIELGFVETLNKYVIIRIKNSKLKMIYNRNRTKKYLLRNKRKDGFKTSKATGIIMYY